MRNSTKTPKPGVESALIHEAKVFEAGCGSDRQKCVVRQIAAQTFSEGGRLVRETIGEIAVRGEGQRRVGPGSLLGDALRDARRRLPLQHLRQSPAFKNKNKQQNRNGDGKGCDDDPCSFRINGMCKSICRQIKSVSSSKYKSKLNCCERRPGNRSPRHVLLKMCWRVWSRL